MPLKQPVWRKGSRVFESSVMWELVNSEASIEVALIDKRRARREKECNQYSSFSNKRFRVVVTTLALVV